MRGVRRAVMDKGCAERGELRHASYALPASQHAYAFTCYIQCFSRTLPLADSCDVEPSPLTLRDSLGNTCGWVGGGAGADVGCVAFMSSGAGERCGRFGKKFAMHTPCCLVIWPHT